MSSPEAITADVRALLDGLPDVRAAGVELESVAATLEQAHEVLVRALDTLDRASAPSGPPRPGPHPQ